MLIDSINSIDLRITAFESFSISGSLAKYLHIILDFSVYSSTHYRLLLIFTLSLLRSFSTPSHNKKIKFYDSSLYSFLYFCYIVFFQGIFSIEIRCPTFLLLYFACTYLVPIFIYTLYRYNNYMYPYFIIVFVHYKSCIKNYV